MKFLRLFVNSSLLSLAVFIFVLSTSQSPVHAAVANFSNTFGGISADKLESVQQTSDGGYIMAGYYTDPNLSGSLGFLVKTNANGEEVWSKTWGDGQNTDFFTSVIQTPDNGFIVAGYTSTFQENGDTDAWLIKTDSAGNQQWQKVYGGAAADGFRDVRRTSDGGYIAVGYTTPGAATDIYLVKTDSSGNMTWSQTYGGDFYDEGQSVQQTSDNGYILTGSTQVLEGDYDLITIRTNTTGVEQWHYDYATEGITELGYSIIRTSDGGYAIAGSAYPSAVLIKLTNTGTESWVKTFNSNMDSIAYSVKQTSDSGYILAGTTNVEVMLANNTNAWLLKTDSSGNQTWENNFGMDQVEEGRDVVQVSGGYVVAGYTSSFGYGGPEDGWVFKVGSTGTLDETNKPWSSWFFGRDATPESGTAIEETYIEQPFLATFPSTKSDDKRILTYSTLRNSFYEYLAYKINVPSNANTLTFTWEGTETLSFMATGFTVYAYNVNTLTWDQIATTDIADEDVTVTKAFNSSELPSYVQSGSLWILVKSNGIYNGGIRPPFGTEHHTIYPDYVSVVITLNELPDTGSPVIFTMLPGALLTGVTILRHKKKQKVSKS